MWSVELPIEAIARAARQPEALTAIEILYRDLAAEIDRFSPTCWNKGLCCHFGKYGHQLFVTPLELAWFVAHLGQTLQSPGIEMSCPYKSLEACSVRPARPMGCRIFYCQSGTESWQQEITERFLGRSKALHSEFDVPYAYCEWLSALRQLTQHCSLFIGLLRESQIELRETAQIMENLTTANSGEPTQIEGFVQKLTVVAPFDEDGEGAPGFYPGGLTNT